MPSDLKSDQAFLGLLQDKYISFNIRRSHHNFSPFPRKVTLLFVSQLAKTIILGIKERGERLLVNNLKQYQNWKDVKNHSFEISPHLFSFLWRFKMDQEIVIKEVKNIEPLAAKTTKKIKTAFNKYRASLRSSLLPGHIYLIPDAEITFNRPDRNKQVYARRVLILEARIGQIVMIPFTTRIERINTKTDILFDSEHKGKRLDDSLTPAVENFPYKIFTRKTALCVLAAQPITTDDFLDSALVCIGSIRKGLTDFVRERLKNL